MFSDQLSIFIGNLTQKDEPIEKDNFRPVSVWPLLSKVFEELT